MHLLAVPREIRLAELRDCIWMLFDSSFVVSAEPSQTQLERLFELLFAERSLRFVRTLLCLAADGTLSAPLSRSNCAAAFAQILVSPLWWW
jgi:hypothetical protein